MDLNQRGIFTLVGFTLLTGTFFNASVSAHEPRLIGDGALNVVVGWDVEPAFSGTLNAFELIVTDDIEVAEIDLTVNVLYLKEDAPDAKVRMSAELEAELRRNRSNPNQFNISVLPTKPGAYGFHFSGMINGIMVDEVFVCGGGTQNADGRSFGCIEKPQKFPSGKKHKRDDDDD
jgi:hypothetical protein